jgi:2-succinyl-5-enolpyruvyl-6-hydroxy-3-cyclohexene-1-carboxylate synthase
VTLLLGDVSLLHDLGALTLALRARGPLTIVVINNQGGRIFEQLPLASHPAAAGRMEYWTTPHAHDFEGAARHFAVPYQRVESVEQLEAALNEAFYRTGKSILLEARLPPGGAAAQSAELSRRISRRLAEEKP